MRTKRADDNTTYLPTLQDLQLGLPSVGGDVNASNMVDWNKGVQVAGGVKGALWEGLGSSGEKFYELLSRGTRKSDITPVDANRAYAPGVYGPTDEVVRIADIRADPDSGAMGRVFGLDREELYDLHQGRPRGTDLGFEFGPRSKGAKHVSRITNPRNAQRLVDAMTEARKYPNLYKGSAAWYEMEPLFDRLKQLTSNPEGKFRDLIDTTAVMSPRAAVVPELERGTHALMLRNQGRAEEFRPYGEIPSPQRPDDFPPELQGMPGSMAHKVHSTMLENLDRTGGIITDQAKVPMYSKGHYGSPDIPYNTRMGAPDAHNARAIGLTDVRPAKKGDLGGNASRPEVYSMLDWFENKVAGASGHSGTDAQALLWNIFAPFTGVKTKIGKSKLELMSEGIERAALHNKIPIGEARDRVIMGELGIPNLNIMGYPKGIMGY